MRNVHVDHRENVLNFQSASLLAKDVARQNQMQDPTILAWHHAHDPNIPHYFDGANPDTWWEKYGTGNGGELEIDIGGDYQFILMDTRGYETLDEIPLRNMSDDIGNEYVCFKPLMKKGNDKPTLDACMPLDEWVADQY